MTTLGPVPLNADLTALPGSQASGPWRAWLTRLASVVGENSATSWGSQAIANGSAQSVSVTTDINVGTATYIPVTATNNGGYISTFGATNSETFTEGRVIVVMNVSGSTTPNSGYQIGLSGGSGGVQYGIQAPDSTLDLNSAAAGVFYYLRPNESVAFRWTAASAATGVGNWQFLGFVPFANQVMLYTPGSYSLTLPSYAKAIRFKFSGGGGASGNGGAGATSGGGAGGGGGGYSELTLSLVGSNIIPGTVISLVVGASGARGTGNGAAGADGGGTYISFTDVNSVTWNFYARGGKGGGGGLSVAGAAAVGGAGGAGNVCAGGAGGNGANGATAATAGAAPTAPGGNGGGGGGGGRTAGVGSAGAASGGLSSSTVSQGSPGSDVVVGPVAGGAANASGGAAITPSPSLQGSTGGSGGGGCNSSGGIGGAGSSGSYQSGGGGGGGGGYTSGTANNGAAGGNGYIYYELLG